MLINNNENTAASTSTTVARRGAFVVLEGVDRCGKTTQSGLLLKKLLAASFSAAAMRFPDRTTATGQLIDSYLQNNSNSQLDDRAVHLLFSANRWEACHHLERQLAAGTTVVCDRYAYSGVAFSGAKVLKDGVTPVLPLEWCKAPDVGLPAPDCVIFLDLQPDEAEARGGYGGERYETRDMQIRVRQRFADLQKADEALVGGSSSSSSNQVPWHIVNAAQSMEAVEQDIWSIMSQVQAQVGAGKLIYQMWHEGEYEWKHLETEN